jgi:hypothetical protein
MSCAGGSGKVRSRNIGLGKQVQKIVINSIIMMFLLHLLQGERTRSMWSAKGERQAMLRSKLFDKTIALEPGCGWSEGFKFCSVALRYSLLFRNPTSADDKS